MNRTFHSRMTVGTLCGIILLAIATMMCFLTRTPIAIICGLLLLILTVVAIERALHTEYRVTGDGHLIISKGRFTKNKEIDLKQATRIEKIRTTFGLSHFLVLRLDGDKTLIIQPENEDEFIGLIQSVRRKDA